MRKIAVLSDIHGNLTALESVLDDAQRKGATDYWILGDILMPGPGSSDLLTKIQRLPNVLLVKGNWEDCFLGAPTQKLVTSTDIYIATLAKYQYENLEKEELEFIRNLPLFRTFVLEDIKFLITHHLPDKNYGRDLVNNVEEKQYQQLFLEDDIDIAIFGHTHAQIIKKIGEKRLILNPGSVGQYNKEKAHYAIFEIHNKIASDFNFVEVPYDLNLEINRATEKDIPYLDVYCELHESGKSYKCEQLMEELKDTYITMTQKFFESLEF